MHPSYLLLIESQGGMSRTVEFGSARVVVGRDAGDIVLPDSQISTTHAELCFDGRRLVLRDLGSTNGTWVGGRRVASQELLAGMSAQLGQHRLKFLGLAGRPTTRGRTVAVQQPPGPWQPPPAAVAAPPWQPLQESAVAGYPVAAPPRRQGSRLGLVLVVLGGIVLAGVLGLGGGAWYLVNRVAESVATSHRPSDGASLVEATFGSRAFRAGTVAASSGDDPRRSGRVVELHAAPSLAALATRSEMLSLGLRADRPGTYAVGPTAAAISFSLGDDEYYLARPGVSVQVVRLEPTGEFEGSFSGNFEHEVSGHLVETVIGKGSFRGKLR
jgi:hypothetical protein